MYLLIEFLKSFLFRSFIIVGSFLLVDIYYKNIEDNILLFLLAILFVERVIYFIKYFRYINLPYSLSLSQSAKDDLKFRSFFVDKFVSKKQNRFKSLIEKVVCKDLNSFQLEYKNYISMETDNYRNKLNQIVHYLGLIKENYEVKVYEYKNKKVLLNFYKLPEFYDISFELLKKDFFFLGIYEKGLYYKDINTLDHLLCIGKSGSGKSNFLQLIILFNFSKFKKLYMIDLKGGVELKSYENIDKEKIEFISSVEELNNILDLVLEDLKSTQKEMIEKKVRKLTDYRIILFDEFGAISSYPDKKLRDQVFNKLSLISMQGRSSGILLFLFGQKIDTTILPSGITNNLQSRILGKTSNDYNINIIDLKENIRERITRVEVQDFKKGRFIFKDGLTSEKNLIQVPYVPDDFLHSFLKSEIYCFL